MDWDTVFSIHQMSLSVPHSAFWDWQIDLCLPSFKYSYTLGAKFGVSKPVLIIDSCVFKSWFTFANVQSVFVKVTEPENIVFCIVFCIWMISSVKYICTLKQHSMSTYMQNKHTWRYLVETENAISKLWIIKKYMNVSSNI